MFLIVFIVKKKKISLFKIDYVTVWNVKRLESGSKVGPGSGSELGQISGSESKYNV